MRSRSLTATVTATGADQGSHPQPSVTHRDRQQWRSEGQATTAKNWRLALRAVTLLYRMAIQAMLRRGPSDATEDPSHAAANRLPESAADLQVCANQP